jgi:four helix bundle protein
MCSQESAYFPNRPVRNFYCFPFGLQRSLTPSSGVALVRDLRGVVSVNPQELRQRLALFARDADEFAAPLLEPIRSREAALQLKRASSGAAANHRAAGRARSKAEFVSKLTTALEEADESQYWLEHLRDCGLASKPPLLAEASELVAILTKSVETARRNRGRW